MRDEIINFQISYAKQIIAHGDQVLILTGAKESVKYKNAIGSANVLYAPMKDIWMRDYTMVNPLHPMIFRYTAAGQGGGKKRLPA